MTLHEICEQARNVPCVCGAPPGCPCVCPDPHGYHPSRFVHARRAGGIGMDDMAYVIRNFPRLVHDPGVTA